jgi:hypothetical protein
MPRSKPNDLKKIWRYAVALNALGAIAALVALLAVPSEAGSAIFLGYSLQRLALAAVAFLPAALFTLLTFSNSLSSSLFTRLSRSRLLQWLAPAFLLAATLLSLLTLFPADRAVELLGSPALYLATLKPLLLYAALLAGSAAVCLFAFQRGWDSAPIAKDKSLVKNAAAFFVILLAVWLLLQATGLGLGADATEWNSPGTPWLLSQLLLSLVLSLLLLLAINWASKRWPRTFALPRLDLLLALLVWLVAAAWWLAQPAAPTYYSSAPKEPNFESYPLSDAFNHDVIANNLLVGEGFRFGDQFAIRRPLYILFLAGVEAVLGQNYAAVIAAQVIVLALFPALLYLLAARMHSRLAGLVLAGFIIFREANSIALGGVINASHAKLLMADLPTALMLAGFALAAFSWLRSPAQHWRPALLTGALMGACVLLRSQNLTVIPVVALLALLVWGWRLAWRQIVLFALGILLIAAPWVVRNKIAMGHWVVEDAANVAGFMANRFRYDPLSYPDPFLPGESEGDYYARQMADVRDFALRDPAYVAGFVADNFARNQMLNFMATPLSWQLRTLESHARQLPYWPGWDGRLAPESYLPVLANAALFALGVAVSWRQYRWAGLVPLFINLGFTANLAVARVSGWRYNLPIDWTVLFYFALGLAQLAVWVLLIFRSQRLAPALAVVPAAQVSRRRTAFVFEPRRFALTALALLLLGSLFPIIEQLSSPRYQHPSQQQVATALQSAEFNADLDMDVQKLQRAVDAGTIYAISGRALYPTFYLADDGNAESSFALSQPMDFRRLTFFVVGPDPSVVALRVEDKNAVLAGSTDVIVLRCDRSQTEAAAVLLTNRYNNRVFLLISSDLGQTCPSLN